MAPSGKTFVRLEGDNTALFKSYVDEAFSGYQPCDNGFLTVANRFGYQFEPHAKTAREVGDFLYDEIRSLLKPTEQDSALIDLRDIYTQLAAEDIIGGQDSSLYYHALSVIKDAARYSGFKPFSYKEEWQKACACAFGMLDLGTDFRKQNCTTESLNFLQAISFFDAYKIKQTLSDGWLDIEQGELDKIYNMINCRAYKLGSKGLDFLNAELAEKDFLSDWIGPFLLRRDVSQMGVSRKPQAPIGYILNILVKHIHRRPPRKAKLDTTWEELKTLARQFAALYRIESYSPYEQIGIQPTQMPEYVRKLILFDNVFLLKQSSLKFAANLINSFFVFPTDLQEKIEEKTGITPDDFKAFFGQIYAEFKNFRGISLCLTKSYLLENRGLLSKAKMERLLKLFSADAKNFNRKYKLPDHHTRSELDDWPFIAVDQNTFIAPNIALFGFQFYERTASILRAYDKQAAKADRTRIDDTIGTRMESVLKSALTRSNVQFLDGEEYKVSVGDRSYMSTGSEDGECDFIIETDNTIFFLELKKKALTRRAASGHVEDILKDVAQLFFESQSQIGRHECLLRKNGKIDFLSGETLQWKNREIERISVSLFDFHALQDTHTIGNLFGGLIGVGLTNETNDPEISKKINTIQPALDTLATQYQLPELQQHIADHSPTPFANVRLFSLQQLMVLLGSCSSNDDFEREVQVTKRVLDGSMNWYSQYLRFRQLPYAQQPSFAQMIVPARQ